MRFLVLVCCLAGAALSPATAAAQSTEVAGVRLADRISVAGRDLVLNGAGLRRFLHMGIYVAALYLPERRHDTHEILNRDIPRSLQLVLLRDVSTQQNLDTLKDGLIANTSPGEMEDIQTEVETFLGYIKGLREVPSGTAIQLNYVPGTGTRVSVNGRFLGTVPGEAFNRAMLRIWLGEDPVQTSLKRALLGAG
jgi:opacity protein-like surface antigen